MKIFVNSNKATSKIMDYYCKYCGTEYNSLSTYNRHNKTKRHQRIVKQFDKMLRSKNNEINKLNKQLNKLRKNINKDIDTIMQICNKAQNTIDNFQNTREFQPTELSIT